MRKLTVIILFISSIMFAQSIGQWKIYSDMKNVKKSVSTSEGVWTVTEGGAFKFNESDSSYIKLTKAEGLNSQALTAMCSDKNQKIWFGSKEGYINIFDPSSGSMERIIDIFSTSKTQKQINDLISVNDTILAATDFGLSLINSTNLSFYDSFLKFGNFAAESKVINVYKNNLIYVVTENGVAIQKPGAKNLSVPESWNSYRFGFEINAQSAIKILESNGELLLATNNGVFRFQNGIWSQYLLAGVNIVDLFIQDNSIYFLSPQILYQYSNGQIYPVYNNTNLVFNSVQISGDKTIYISSNNGLLEIKNGITKVIYPDGPLANKFVNLAADQEGNIWVATGKDGQGVGIMKFDGNLWKYFNTTTNPELQSNDFYNVSTFGNTVLLSNWGNGITIYKDGKFETYNAYNTDIIGIPDHPNFVSISDAQADSKGNIWIANNTTSSRKQLSVLTSANNWYHFNVNNLGSNALSKMVIDQFDTKWFIVNLANAGLYYFNEKNTFSNLDDDFQGYISSNDGLITNDISALAIDKRGQLWIGTSDGISLIQDPSRPKNTITNKYAPPLRNVSVTCIAIDPLDNKWVGTNQGVFVLSSDGINLLNYFTTKNSPLPNDDIKSIAVNPITGVAFIGTDFGLASITTSSIQPVESFTELFVYPNPFILDGSGSFANIDGLIKNTSIKILDISGKSVRTFVTPGGKIAFWDGRDDDGKYVASGIYIITAYDEEANNVMTAKIAVIKK